MSWIGELAAIITLTEYAKKFVKEEIPTSPPPRFEDLVTMARVFDSNVTGGVSSSVTPLDNEIVIITEAVAWNDSEAVQGVGALYSGDGNLFFQGDTIVSSGANVPSSVLQNWSMPIIIPYPYAFKISDLAWSVGETNDFMIRYYRVRI